MNRRVDPRSVEVLPRAFHANCERFADRDAQRFNPELYPAESRGSLTWSELRERVESLAAGLLALGLQRQEFVAILGSTGIYWTHADLACAISGAVSVAIYPTLSFGETSFVLNDSKPRFLFVGDDETLRKLLAKSEAIPSVEYFIVMQRGYRSDDERVLGFDELMTRGAEWLVSSRPELEALRHSIGDEDLYTIHYTSGTTGDGKGVMVTHWAVRSRMAGVSEFFGRYGMSVGPDDVGLCYLPLAHVFDRGSLQLLAVYSGATIAYGDKPGTLLADLAKYNPTWMNGVPRLYEKIYIGFREKLSKSRAQSALFAWALGVGEKVLEYRRTESGAYDMSPEFRPRLPFGLAIQYRVADLLFARVRALFGQRLRFAFSASAGISKDLLRFYYTVGVPICEGYGSTETFNACVLNPIRACKPGYVGIDANGSQTRIAEDGELEVTGAGVFRGYLHREDETKESFAEAGYLRTGDLVEIDSNGYIRMVDRKKAIICTAIGKNIAPAKLERFFSTSQTIDQIFFVGDERNYITALVVPNFVHFMTRLDEKGAHYDRDALRWASVGGIQLCMEVGEDLASLPLIQDAIASEIDAVNQELEHFERIRRFRVLRHRFSEENGQLTPTQKPKKRAIVAAYGELIEAMYGSGE